MMYLMLSCVSVLIMVGLLSMVSMISFMVG